MLYSEKKNLKEKNLNKKDLERNLDKNDFKKNLNEKDLEKNLNKNDFRNDFKKILFNNNNKKIIKKIFEKRKEEKKEKNLEEISFEDLLIKIISLSYVGDIRMSLGVEPKNKFEKVLKGQKKNLKEIYSPFFKKYFNKEINEKNIFFNFDENYFFDILKKRNICFINKNDNLDIYKIKNSLITIKRNSSLKMGLSQFLGGSFSQNFKYMLQKVFK